jgi:hypothetical protein
MEIKRSKQCPYPQEQKFLEFLELVQRGRTISLLFNKDYTYTNTLDPAQFPHTKLQ